MRRNFNNWKVENVFQKQKIENKIKFVGKNENFVRGDIRVEHYKVVVVYG